MVFYKEHTDSEYNLSINEEHLGPDPAVLEYLRALDFKTHLYPDPNCLVLKEAISRFFGPSMDNIFCGNGSEEIIYLLSGHALSRGGQGLIFQHSFPVFAHAIKCAGGAPVQVPNPDFTYNLERMLDHVTNSTKIIFIDNPGNPTGCFLSKQAFLNFMEAIPKEIMVVLDEAYFDYVEDQLQWTGLDLLQKHPNLVVLRTFSKFYGLGGIRCGWAAASPDLIEILEYRKPLYHVNSLAQKIVPIALQDSDHYAVIKLHTINWRQRLRSALGGLGAKVNPSQTNFVMPIFNGSMGAEFERILALENIKIRNLSPQGIEGGFRISISQTHVMERVIDILALNSNTIVAHASFNDALR